MQSLTPYLEEFQILYAQAISTLHLFESTPTKKTKSAINKVFVKLAKVSKKISTTAIKTPNSEIPQLHKRSIAISRAKQNGRFTKERNNYYLRKQKSSESLRNSAKNEDILKK